NGGLKGITNWSRGFAGDGRTGKGRWRGGRVANYSAGRPKICCGVGKSGIATSQRDIIAPVIDCRTEGPDGATGKSRWAATCGSHLRRNRQRWSMAGRVAAVQRQRQPVCVFYPGRQTRHGRVEMVLPAGSRRFLGL